MLSYEVGNPYNAKIIIPATEFIAEMRSVVNTLHTPIDYYLETTLGCCFLNFSNLMEMRDYNFLEEPNNVIDDVIDFTVSDMEGSASIPLEFDEADVHFITLMVHDLYILLLSHVNNECLLRGCKLEFYKEQYGNIEFFYYHHFVPFQIPTYSMLRKLEINCFYIQEYFDYHTGVPYG